MIKVSITTSGVPFNAKSFADQVMADVMKSFEKEIRAALAGISSETGEALEVEICREGDTMNVKLRGSDAAVAEAQAILDNLS